MSSGVVSGNDPLVGTVGDGSGFFDDGPVDWSMYDPSALANFPPWAIVLLQVVFYIMLAFILLYLVSHWIFHSWSFGTIVQISRRKAKQAGDKATWSDKFMPYLTVVMFLLYTAYMVGFIYVTVIMLQFRKYFTGFLPLVSRSTLTSLNTLLWVFFGMAFLPTVLNMIAALIKMTRDFFYVKRVRDTFATRRAEFVRDFPDMINFTPAPAPTQAVTGKVTDAPMLAHSAAAIPGLATERGLPLVYIFVPTYNEPLPNLLGAINGIAASDYPRLRIYVGFDNYDVEETFFTLCRLMSGVEIKRTRTMARPTRRGVPTAAPVPNGAGSAAPSPMYPASDAPAYDADLSDATLEPVLDAKATKELSRDKYNGISQMVATRDNGSTVGAPPRVSGSLVNGASPAFGAFGGSNVPAIVGGAGTPSFIGSVADTGIGAGARRNSLDFDADNCPDEYTLEYKGVRFSVFRFEHSGKLGTQRNMYERMLAELEAEDAGEEPLVLFMDSDTAILQDTVSQMVAEMQRNPQTKACTGFVVSRNEDSYNLWRIMQDAEYIESMIFRNAEALMGAVTCLPGVLTMFNFHALNDVAGDYFYQEAISSTFDFCRRYLGEDRYMTHILMERPGTGVLGFNPRAIVKTEAPSNFYDLLRQRRRWFLGTISNEIAMLCTPLFWAKFPILMITKFFMVLKVGGAITYVLLMEVLFNLIFDAASFNWTFLFWLGIIMVPNWLFVTVWALSERRFKSVLSFPLYYWFTPIFTIAILMYSFLTVRQRTWGGPRAAAASGGDAGDAGNPHGDGSGLEDGVDGDPTSEGTAFHVNDQYDDEQFAAQQAAYEAHVQQVNAQHFAQPQYAQYSAPQPTAQPLGR